MVKEVVFLHCSPRKKGNTRALANQAMAALADMGVASAEIDVPRPPMKHPGCIACFKCQQSEAFGCHVNDDLARAVATLPDYDAIVLATPVYWFGCTAQGKMFIDRMFSLIKFDENHVMRSPLAGKPLALLATAGGVVEENLELLEMPWSVAAKRLGAPFLSCLFPLCHYAPGEAAGDPALAAKAREFGSHLGALL